MIKESPVVEQQNVFRKPQPSMAKLVEAAQIEAKPGPIFNTELVRKQEHARSTCHHQIQTTQQHDDMHKTVQHPEEEDDVLSLLVCQAKAYGWFIDPREIEFKEQVAEGSTATVHKATWRGLEVAVKCINADLFNENENGLWFFIQELLTLSVQRHPFVLRLMGACLSPPDHGWVVTEYLKITLSEWLHGPGSRRRERLIELPQLKARLTKALEISQAMQYLHERRPMLVHRDLKPSNIFLDDSGHVRVADFGHATLVEHGEKALTGETGTYVYMAPEVFLSKPYDEKCDVFSFGVILNELMTGDYPYIDTDLGPYQIAAGVAAGELRPTLAEDGENQLGEMVDLISKCWDSDESVRPCFGTITCALKNILENLIIIEEANPVRQS
uniref:Protein kinase domain-containing protein n=1 Tax=Kalanchoe fedtschenkoi TaxID=63787 RepID=A0A7N0RCY3_KALFE